MGVEDDLGGVLASFTMAGGEDTADAPLDFGLGQSLPN
jgi:hypothetical protein